jgi:hypothetical protein
MSQCWSQDDGSITCKGYLFYFILNISGHWLCVWSIRSYFGFYFVIGSQFVGYNSYFA